MTALFEQDVTLRVRLPWPTICRLACRALVSGVSIDALCDEALREHIARARAGA